MGYGLWVWIPLLILLLLGLRSLVVFMKSSYHFKAAHLVIITNNNQHSIEWLIRSYHLANFLNGRYGKITCLDTGSKDDTVHIITKLTERYPQLHIVSLEETTDEPIESWIHTQSGANLVVLDIREER